MTDTPICPTDTDRFDRPSEHLATENTQHAPWHEADDAEPKVNSQHCQHHSLFEDLLN